MLYNRYREPEAKAKLLSIDHNTLKVKFEGPFCTSCGIIDWIEDFKYVLEDLGIESELIGVIEPENEENTLIGVFKIKRFKNI